MLLPAPPDARQTPPRMRRIEAQEEPARVACGPWGSDTDVGVRAAPAQAAQRRAERRLVAQRHPPDSHLGPSLVRQVPRTRRRAEGWAQSQRRICSPSPCPFALGPRHSRNHRSARKCPIWQTRPTRALRHGLMPPDRGEERVMQRSRPRRPIAAAEWGCRLCHATVTTGRAPVHALVLLGP